jgi:hypothetical protein
VLEIVQGSESDLLQFLDFMYGNQEGYVYTSTKDINEDDPKKAWRRHFYEWPKDRPVMVEHIKAAGETLDIYIAPAMFSNQDSSKGSVKGSHVFWVDLDGKIPDDLGDIPAPSLVVQSSNENRQHWYWRVEEFINDIPLIEKVNRGLAYALGADVSGWDANQVLRPPETFNHKRQRPVVLLALSPWSVNPSSFGAIPEPPKPETEFSLNDLLDSALIISKYEWPKQAFNLYRTQVQNLSHKEGRSGALMQVAYFCCEMGMNDQEAFTILYNADERWGKFKDRPDRARRLNDIIVKARIKHPYNLTLKVRDLPVFGFSDFLKTEVSIEWVIPGMLEQSGQMLISAAPGVGKSRLSLSAGIRLALGTQLSSLRYYRTKEVDILLLGNGFRTTALFLGEDGEILYQGRYTTFARKLASRAVRRSIILRQASRPKISGRINSKTRTQGYHL